MVHSSKTDLVFSTDPDGGNARIEFKNNKFYLVSHKTGEKVKDIILSASEMLDLCRIFPMVRQLQLDTQRQLNETIVKNAEAVLAGEPSLPPPSDEEQFSVTLSTYKSCHTKLLLNSHKQKTFVWVRKFVESNEDEDQSHPSLIKTLYPCQGGIILTDVIPKELTAFVTGCIKMPY
jgi:hypothetical protein